MAESGRGRGAPEREDNWIAQERDSPEGEIGGEERPRESVRVYWRGVWP